MQDETILGLKTPKKTRLQQSFTKVIENSRHAKFDNNATKRGIFQGLFAISYSQLSLLAYLMKELESKDNDSKLSLYVS